MLRKRIGVSATVSRYTLLLALLFAIPLITFVVVDGFVVSRVVEDQVVESYASELERITAFLDQEMGRLTPLANAIHRNENLRGFWYTGSPYDSGAGRRALQEFAVANGFFEHIILYSESRDYVLANGGSYPPELLFVDRYSTKEWNRENLSAVLDSINSRRNIAFAEESVDSGSIGIFQPIPIVGAPTRGFVSFIVRYALLDELIQSQSSGEMKVYLFDEDFSLVYRSYRESPSRAGILADYLATVERGMHTATLDIGGESVLLAADRVSSLDWHVVALSPTSVATSRVQRLRALLLLVILGLVGLGIPFIYAVVRHLHRPLRRLAESLGSGGLYDSTGDEWERIESFVHDLRSENVQLRSFRSFSQSSAASRLYLRLLRGQFETFEEFDRLSAFVEHPVGGEGCFVAVVGVGTVSFEHPGKKQDMVESLNQAAPSEFSFVAVDALEKTIIPIVAQTENPGTADNGGSTGILEYLRGIIHNRLGAAFSIGVGSECACAREVPSSLNQAKTALKYSFVYRPGTIITYGDIENRENSLAPPPRKQLDGLRDSLARVDVTETEEACHALVDELRAKQYSIRVARIAVAEVMGMLWQHLSSAGLPPQRRHDVLNMIGDLDHAANLADFQAGVVAVAKVLFHEAQCVDPHLRSTRLVHEVAEYLESSYNDGSLTLGTIAERFGLSPSNLTHHFKTKLGTTVMAYLDSIRMAQARRLLLESDRQVAQIVHDVGCYDVSNFIRKFKQQVGTTPAQYRETASQPAR